MWISYNASVGNSCRFNPLITCHKLTMTAICIHITLKTTSFVLWVVFFILIDRTSSKDGDLLLKWVRSHSWISIRGRMRIHKCHKSGMSPWFNLTTMVAGLQNMVTRPWPGHSRQAQRRVADCNVFSPYSWLKPLFYHRGSNLCLTMEHFYLYCFHSMMHKTVICLTICTNNIIDVIMQPIRTHIC